MAPKVTIKTLSCEQMYRNLIRMHLPGHTSSLNWNTTNLAMVTAHHEKFLCEVGRTGCSIHVKILAKCLVEHFNCMGWRNFANKLADALAFCRANGKPTPKKGTSTKSCGYTSLLKNQQETIDGNGWTDWLQADLGRICGL
jgi:hypothetical protein